MVQHSPTPGKSSLPDIIPPVDLPPEFERFLTKYTRDHGFKAAINWYQTELTASDVKDRDTAGLTKLEQILRHDTRFPATSISPHWVPKKDLGKGKYGVVVLWERKMGINKQPEHVACKDSKFDYWFQDYCTEAHLTRRLNATGCVNIVKVFDWMSIRSQKLYRILYEYCPHGTLHDLYVFYKWECKVTIPESFLWHVFHSLATVICYHAYGTTDGKSIPGWTEIVHRDVKPSNILLSGPEPNNRNLYPTLKLADYGLAYSIPNDEIRRLKRTLWTGGTQGYVAPEANNRIRDDPNQAPHPIASHLSDIYSIGCIMIDFLRLPMSRYSKSSWELLDLDLNFAYQYYPYSRGLVDLARECIKPNPKDRPRAIALYQRTRRQAEESYDLVEKASKVNYSRPGTPFTGQMLWNSKAQEGYRASGQFRNAYKNANDWFSTHSHEIQRLDEAATTPLEDDTPPSGYVAIGNGLGGCRSLVELREGFGGVPLKSYLAIMKVYDASGRELVRKWGEPILRYIAQDRLIVPKPNRIWQESNTTQQAVQLKHREGWDKVRDEEIAEQTIARGVQASLDKAGGGFSGKLVVRPQVPQDSRKGLLKYQPYTTPKKGLDRKAHGRGWLKSRANPTVSPYTPPRPLPKGPDLQPPRQVRAGKAPQYNNPRRAPTGRRDVTAPTMNPTPVPRLPRLRRKVAEVERAVVKGTVDRTESSRARQQEGSGFSDGGSVGWLDHLP